jgi:hypothetical protein
LHILNLLNITKRYFNLYVTQIQTYGLLCKGDPYLGGREGEMKKKNKEIEDLKRELAAVRRELNSVQNSRWKSTLIWGHRK